MKENAARRQRASGKTSTGGEYANFSSALKRVLSVSPSDLKAKLQAEESAKRQVRASASDRAASDKG